MLMVTSKKIGPLFGFKDNGKISEHSIELCF